MSFLRSIRWTPCLLGAFLLAGATAVGDQTGSSGRDFVRVRPDQIKWVTQPDGLGVEVAVVEGDPAKAGVYMTMVHFPPGVMSRPHYHPEERYCVVVKGTWYTSTSDEFKPESAVPLKVGSYMRHPAGGHHYDGAKEEDVIVAISGYGPSKNTILDNGPLFGRSVPAKK